MAKRWTPRLRTIFFGVNILILLLPLGGVVLVRLYESVLIRRTETELVMQGAHVAASYLSALHEEEGTPPGPAPAADDAEEAPLEPFEAKLDLAFDVILPPPPASRPASGPASPAAERAGQRITEAIRSAQKTTLAGIRVVDEQGVVVATTRTELGRSLAHLEEVRRALRGENVSLMRQRVSDEPPPPLDSISRGTQLRVFVGFAVLEGDRVRGAVILSRTPQAVSQSLYTLRWHILAAGLLLLALNALISLVTSQTVTRPMEELIRQSERVARGEKGAATPLSSAGALEVRQVSEAVARMARALEERADYINTFARGVSHEFKTPLASMRGAVELLRDNIEEMTPEERNRFLCNLEQDTERLTRLVSRLTDLARADVITPTEQACAADEVVEEIVERFRGHGLAVEVEADERVGTVKMAREPFEAVVANLVDNARQHGGPDVSVTIRSALVHDACGAELAAFEVRDDGPGISEANLGRVFDRFFTTARDHGGSGLGLNIVKKLVEVHGGSITLASRPGETVFRVTLPAATARAARSSRH